VVAVPNGYTAAADFSCVHAVYRSLHEVGEDLDALLAN
jgi:hypothetical protein